ncbi:MAG: tRNA (cytidine(34)-2'-O)-methyltransferase [Thiohalomonadales bacterium]
MFHIALYEPRIAPNTGNIIRLVANNGCRLHLIEPLGFDLEEKKLRRAGLDYHDLAKVTRHANYSNFIGSMEGCRILACSTRGSQRYDTISYQRDDVLLFGSETQGLPDDVLYDIEPSHRLRIPMCTGNRSLNLSNAVAIVSSEAWRQHGFVGSE